MAEKHKHKTPPRPPPRPAAADAETDEADTPAATSQRLLADTETDSNYPGSLCSDRLGGKFGRRVRKRSSGMVSYAVKVKVELPPALTLSRDVPLQSEGMNKVGL